VGDNSFAELTNRVYRDDARIIIEKSGMPVAGLISAGDLLT
jgi:prevent-host-death family protein